MAQFDISAETLRLINESPMTIFVWRAEQGWPVEFVSENVRQFGYSPEDFLSGKIKYEDIIHPDDIEEIHIRFATCIKEGDSNFSH